MAIPDSFIQELLHRVDIVDIVDSAVPLKKAGANYSACCPFHNEKTPSFTVSPTKQFYHCFGCGAHGSAIGFLMNYQGLGFVEAVQDLAKRVGLTVPEERQATDPAAKEAAIGMHEMLQQALQYYRTQLKHSPPAIQYLKGRGLSGEIAARFQMGYAPGGWQNLQQAFPNYQDDTLQSVGLVITNDQGRRYDRFRDRIMFPIHDQRGQVIGFGGRVIAGGDEAGPKYLNSPETPLFQKGYELYGLFLARRSIREAGRAVVVEGYMDVVALAQHGIGYAVATLGTATTPHHITKLMRQTDDIVFCFDGDQAGKNAAWKAAMNSLPALTDGLKLSFLFLPPEHDPDTYVREFGQSGFETALKNALPLSQYLVQTLAGQHELKSQEGKVRFLKEFEPILSQIKAPALQMLLRKQVAALAEVTPEELRSLIKLPRPENARAAAPARRLRTPPSLGRRLLVMVLAEPALCGGLPASLITGNSRDDQVLRHALSLISATPSIKPAALLETLRSATDEEYFKTLSAEVIQHEEHEGISEEFEGALQQLRGQQTQTSLSQVLRLAQERGLHALSDEQRLLLQRFRRGEVKEDT